MRSDGPDGGDPLAGSQRYKTIAVLGRGGMGQVLEAERVGLGNRVAVKVLHRELAAHRGIVDRLRVEAQALARLDHHPHVVAVLDVDTTPDGRPFVVMERLRGRSLREELRSRGVLPPDEAIRYAQQALSALGAAHEIGLVHRDVKLDNLFLCDATGSLGRTIKVLDFGVAKVLRGSGIRPLAVKTETGTIVGTPRFMSTEQARGGPVTPATDIYAMGLVLYSLVVGRGPFDGAAGMMELVQAHVEEPPPLPSSLASFPIPAALENAILKALAKDPGDRFATAEAFSAALDEASSEARSARKAELGFSPSAPAMTTEDLPTNLLPVRAPRSGEIGRRGASTALLVAGLVALVALLAWLAVLFLRRM